MKLSKVLVAGTVIGIVAVSVTVMLLLINTKPESKKAPSSIATLGVKTLTAQLGDYDIEVNYPGRVASGDMVTLSSEVSGRLKPTNTPLKVGQTFRKGDLLVDIFDEDVRASHTAQVSSFLTILASALPDLKIDMPDQYNKWYEFFGQINVNEKLPSLPAVSSDKEKVYLSSKGILSAYYNIVTSEITLDKYQIKAPFNGTYTSVSKEVGSISSVNGEIARLASTDALELVVGVPVDVAQTLVKGTTIEITSGSKKSYKGHISRISPFVDQATQRVNVYVRFSEPSLDIIEGQLLSITVPSKKIDGVQKILREAVIGDSIVYTVIDNKLQSKAINVVTTTPEFIYITGLANGEVVVGESLVSPYNGMSIEKLDMNGNSTSPKQKTDNGETAQRN